MAVVYQPGGLTRIRWAQYEMVTSAKLRLMSDFLSASVLDILGYLMMAEDDDPSSCEGVIGGFVASNIAGTMNASVSRGAALWCNASVPLVYSMPQVVLMLARAATTLALDPGDAQPRIDVIYVRPQEQQATSASVQIYQGGVGPWVANMENQEQRNVPIFAVEKGTPAAVPVAPVPLTGIPLCQVLVPAGSINLDAATFTDVRTMVGPVGMSGAIPWAAVEFEGLAGAILGNAHNVSSVTKLWTGAYQLNLTNPIPSGKGVVFHGTAYHQILGSSIPVVVSVNSLVPGTVIVRTQRSSTEADIDAGYINVLVELVR